jgi:hypothetical protein
MSNEKVNSFELVGNNQCLFLKINFQLNFKKSVSLYDTLFVNLQTENKEK